jgi:hypothetical protein
MSPLRWEVLGLALVLALPVLAMGLRGDLALADVVSRLPWCLAAAWGAVALLTAVAKPRPVKRRPTASADSPTTAEAESTPAP